MRELTELHNKHVNQVGFDGEVSDEQNIEILTAEITGVRFIMFKKKMNEKRNERCENVKIPYIFY